MPDSIFELQAELCKTMGNAARLQIVHCLRTGPQRVSDIIQATGLAQVSQHLAALRARGIVTSERRGKDMVYRISNPKIVRVCDLMREVLVQQAAERSEIIQTLKKET
jgi:ArsR family transcriptional regulator